MGRRIVAGVGALIGLHVAVACVGDSPDVGGGTPPAADSGASSDPGLRDATTTVDTQSPPSDASDASNTLDASNPSDASDAGADADAEALSCPAGYEDLNGIAADGCEGKNPLAIAAASLNLWLRADDGVTVSGSVVQSWKNLAPSASRALDSVKHAGTPTLDPVAWVWGPKVRPTIVFKPGDSLTLDLKALAATAGATLYIVEARQGSAKMGVAGSRSLSGESPCQTQVSPGFRLVYEEEPEDSGDQKLRIEPWYNAFAQDVPEQGAGAFQPNVLTTQIKPTGDDPAWRWWIQVNGSAPLGTPTSYCSYGPLSPVATESLLGTVPALGSYTETTYQGYIAEVVAYDTPLSDVDRDAVRKYLRDKWGLP